MKDLKTEYKVAIIIISIMVVLLVVVLITTGSFEKLFLKYKKDSLINCTSERIEEKLNYVSTKCVIKDESDNTYQLSYPKFENNTINLNNINNSFKNSYELFIKEIQYKGEDKSLSIQLMQQLNYKIINYSNYYFVIKIIRT